LKLVPLPATKTEASNISNLFRSATWNVNSFNGTDASEANLRNLTAHDIVHIATHSLFHSNSDTVSSLTNDLLSCSFYLAGANRTLTSGSIDPKNDGVVSALEAMYLNLSNTDLVTLSACESGRGKAILNEGVFGFPRALRIAGAKNILMSLWQIPDKETSELMTFFYSNMLAGLSKSEALRTAW
jgi:CHAT domain-containing protein